MDGYSAFTPGLSSLLSQDEGNIAAVTMARPQPMPDDRRAFSG